ncbi:DUF1028 domain-containing protein [Bacillus seohaeanensis]|uniref:DUF1028 domain-containing protein n=1 Tax=Bacillus seohaeanensis TaxID=284580 RepID=A0ABW5RL13_9BACI
MVVFSTFSITARCPETGMLGVAVSTARPAVGSLAPYVKAGVGAIATQALVNPFYGIDGLNYLESGLSPEEVLEKLLAADEEKEKRQLAIVSNNGEVLGYTGSDTVPWQGHHLGEGFVVAGNMLTGPETLDAMKRTYETSQKSFPEKLLDVLKSGQEAGGDKRGKQSAALYIVDTEQYPYIDLRVDEHSNPVAELIRVYRVCEKDLFPYTKNLPKRQKKGGGSSDE